MKPKALLTERQKMIFAVVLFHEGCTFNLLMDKLAHYFGYYPGTTFINELLIDLVGKNILEIKVLNSKEPTERFKTHKKPRKYIYFNQSKDNPCRAIIQRYSEYIDKVVKTSNSQFEQARKAFAQDYINDCLQSLINV